MHICITQAQWVNWALGDKFLWNLNQNTTIFIQENLKMPCAKGQPVCLSLNVSQVMLTLWKNPSEKNELQGTSKLNPLPVLYPRQAVIGGMTCEEHICRRSWSNNEVTYSGWSRQTHWFRISLHISRFGIVNLAVYTCHWGSRPLIMTLNKRKCFE